MSFKRVVLLISSASVFSWVVASADAPGVRLIRQGGTDRINPLDEHFHRGMTWSHGGYVVMDTTQDQPPTFYSLDRDGAWTDTAHFRNPEPTGFEVFSYDRQADGTIVFSGQTVSAPRVVSPFLAWTSADGERQRIVHTDRYFPYHIAVAPDDTIWTLGYEMATLDDTHDTDQNKEAHVLRHFDSRGNLIASAFPQSQFDGRARFRITHGLLAATGDRVGWYGPEQGKGTYTEISLVTMTVKEYPGAVSNPSREDFAEALAMTNGGVASVSVVSGSPRALTNYVLDRAVSKWVAVSVPPLGGFKIAPRLIGNDGDTLVFHFGTEAGFFSVTP